MPLQIDATRHLRARRSRRTARCPTSDKLDRLAVQHLPHTGLPPTPIAAVSDASLKAALAPAQTDVPLLRASIDKDGHHRVRDDARAAATRTSTPREAERRVADDLRRDAGRRRHRRSRCGTRCRRVLHNAAYRALGLDWVYVAFEVPDGGAAAALDAMRALGLVGLSVTMPHKTAVAAACDELSPTRPRCTASTPSRSTPGGRLVGDSTDGEGFLRRSRDAGHDPAGASVAACSARAARPGPWRARWATSGARVDGLRPQARRRRGRGRARGRYRASPWDERGGRGGRRRPRRQRHADRDGRAVRGRRPPVPARRLHPGQVVADLVYHPLETPLLRGARGRGADVVDGLGMLVHQAALQVERWTGRDAPVAVMRAAAELALDRPPA